GLDVADEAVVDDLTAALDRRALPRADEPAVDAADADGRNSELAADGEDPRIDLAVHDHRRDLERPLVGDAPALDEPALKPQPLGELRRLRSAAVHDDDSDPDLMQ